MSNCRENLMKNKTAPTTPKLKSGRECCCIKEYNQLKNNLKALQSITQPSTDKQSKLCKSKMNKTEKPKCDGTPKSVRSSNRTWFDVLRETPKKQSSKQVLTDILNVKQLKFSDNTDLFRNVEPKALNLLLDDEKFLKQLIEMNNKIQSETTNVRKSSRDISITDDDKFKSYVETKLKEESHKQKEKQNLQAKALVKLLENMQSVSENSEVQRETLNNLTQIVIQLREENKMLDKLKEVRIDLESKLSSLSTENMFLKKQLETAEAERRKANRILDNKEKEIEMLKKHITAIKGKIANKIDSGIKYDFDDASLELNHLDDTLASLPSNNHSFDAPIRPASSSPTEEVLHKWKSKSLVGRLEEDSGIQSNPKENCDSLINDKVDVTSKLQVLSDLKNNVKKTVEELQFDMKFNDVSLNLSDATYKLSTSSIV